MPRKTAPVIEDTVTEEELLTSAYLERKERSTQARAPRGFDPAALFLLDMRFDNLFDPRPGSDWIFTCRGCGDEVKRPDRETHHAKHKREVARGDHKRREARTEMAKERLAAARERRGSEATDGETIETPEATPARAEKPARERVAGKPKDITRSLALCDKLTAQLEQVFPGLAHVTNEATGFRSFKLTGKLIGYAWFTTKDDLRLEWAIQNDDVPAKQRGRVKPYKRSKDIATAGRIEDKPGDLTFAVDLFKRAAKKQGV